MHIQLQYSTVYEVESLWKLTINMQHKERKKSIQHTMAQWGGSREVGRKDQTEI